MAKAERLFSAEEGAYMTRLTLSSFRGKASKLGIKGSKEGVKVFYTRKQLENIYSGTAAKAPTAKAGKKPAAKKAGKKPTRKVTRAVPRKRVSK